MADKTVRYALEFKRQMVDLVRSGKTPAEREELVRLRRENRKLKEEREILSKAAAWFANDSTATSKRSSGS